jgi:hypothetical protein
MLSTRNRQTKRARAPARVAVVRTRRGARLLHDGHVVSEMVAAPGPTHSLFDILAAATVVHAPGPRLLVLGFGAGGLIAPLRALGRLAPIDAVDIDRQAADVYRRIVGDRLGDVRIHIADAVAFLEGTRALYDAVVLDLSLPVPGDLVMPECCFGELPALIARRIARRGIMIMNVFSPGAGGWARHLRRILTNRQEALVVTPGDFDHRIVITGATSTARENTILLNGALARISSRQRGRLSTRPIQAEAPFP